MNTEKNCQSCKYYKDGYCENLEVKPCYPQKGCEYFGKVEQESILDKIRAEIMQLDYDIEDVDYDYNDMAQTEMVHTICREEMLQIIDKYMVESEDK